MIADINNAKLRLTLQLMATDASNKNPRQLNNEPKGTSGASGFSTECIYYVRQSQLNLNDATEIVQIVGIIVKQTTEFRNKY